MRELLKQIISIFVIIGAVSIITPLIIPHFNSEQLSYLESSYFAILIAVTIFVVSKEKQKNIVEDISEIKKLVMKIEEKMRNESKSVPTPATITSQDMTNFIEEWKIVIKTQMHFNDMIMKVRTATISFVVGVFGAAAYILQYDIPLKILGHTIHAAAMVIITGIAMLSVMFVIDYHYYFKMLIGAVKVGYQFEEEFKQIGRTHKFFTLSSSIRDSIGKSGRSKYYVIIFYSVIIFAGLVFLISVLLGYNVGL